MADPVKVKKGPTKSASGKKQRMHGWLAAAVFVSVVPGTAFAQGAGSENAPAPTVTDETPGGSLTRMGGDLTGTIPAPPVTFDIYVDLAEGYDTNAQGYGGSNSDDTFTRGRIGADLRYNKPRLIVDVSYSLWGEYWSKFHQLNHLSHHLALTSRLVAIPEMLFITANAFATPADLTRIGSISAGGEAVSRENSRDSYGYSLSPELRLRFKDYFTSTTTATHGGVFFVRPSTSTSGTTLPIIPAQNAYNSSLTEEIASGTYFGRLRWSVTGMYTQSSQTVQTETEEQGLASLEYALTESFRILAVGGYSNYKSSVALSKDLSGPTALGGFTYAPSEDLSFTAQAGTRNNFPTYLGSANWQITPLTNFTATLTDEVSTPQGDILSRLGTMGGNFSDALSSGLGNFGSGWGSYGGSVYGNGGLALDNSIYHMRSINGSLSHSIGLTRITLTAYGSERDALNATLINRLPRSSVYGLNANVFQPLSANLTAQLGAGYSFSSEFGGHDRIISVDGQMTYHLTDKIDLYLTDHFVHRTSLNQVVTVKPLNEDQVLIGIRARL